LINGIVYKLYDLSRGLLGTNDPEVPASFLASRVNIGLGEG
jgi:hypothetical protein